MRWIVTQLILMAQATYINTKKKKMYFYKFAKELAADSCNSAWLGGATATKTTPEQPLSTTAISWVHWKQPSQQIPGLTWSNFFLIGCSTRASPSTNALELSSLSVISRALDPATPSFMVPILLLFFLLILPLFRILMLS